MKLSAITDEISMDLAHALDVMKGLNCAGAELRGAWNTNIADFSDEQADEAKKLVEDREMAVCALSTPLFKCHFGKEVGEVGRTHQARERSDEQQMDLLRRCAQLAKFFGTRYIRMFSYWRIGDITPQIEDAIAEGIADAVKYAEDNDIVLLMENEHDCSLGTGVETARFLARVDSPALRAVWDPGNAFFADENPFPDGWNAIRNFVEHVHVKDAELLASGRKRFVVVGDGEIDYEGQFDALRADGYEGYISLETHYRPFGGTPEQASVLCLQGMNKLLSE